jgi:hypothetical protein
LEVITENKGFGKSSRISVMACKEWPTSPRKAMIRHIAIQWAVPWQGHVPADFGAQRLNGPDREDDPIRAPAEALGGIGTALVLAG